MKVPHQMGPGITIIGSRRPPSRSEHRGVRPKPPAPQRIQPNSRALATAALEARARKFETPGVVTASLIQLWVRMAGVGVLLIGDGEIRPRHRHDDAVALNLYTEIIHAPSLQ